MKVGGRLARGGASGMGAFRGRVITHLRIAARAVRDFCGSQPVPPSYNESQAVATAQQKRRSCEASVDFTESQRVTNRRMIARGVSLRIAARAVRDFCGSHPVPPGYNESQAVAFSCLFCPRIDN